MYLDKIFNNWPYTDNLNHIYLDKKLNFSLITGSEILQIIVNIYIT